MITDHFGRKPPITIGCAIMTVGAILQGSCQNIESISSLFFFIFIFSLQRVPYTQSPLTACHLEICNSLHGRQIHAWIRQ